jgi:arylsulfatase A-like enzyme
MCFAFIHRKILGKLGLRETNQQIYKQNRLPYYSLHGLFIISSILILARFDFSVVAESIPVVSVQNINTKPNILLLGSDGLNAANLSVYGYERVTTPTMQELAPNSLLAENAFTNAAQSSGSITSILNSRLPLQTRVLNTPDILQGKDSFLHLPGILRREGYYTAQIGIGHYIDSYALNLRNGFDMVNNRSLEENIYFQNTHSSSLDDTYYFIYQLSDRLFERLEHIFFIQKMEHPISEVTGFEDFHRDEKRLEQLLDIITNINEPFFVHSHMMVTHGEKFFPPIREFSRGQTQTEEWMTDFYDDAILSFDADLRTILDSLERVGKSDNTILIIYTDHAQNYSVNVRIPLIFRFLKGEYTGQVQANVQNLDIAPTILDYLGLPIPDWMEGISLLSSELTNDRLIMSYGMKADRSERELLKPPFFQFGFFYIVQCDRWYQFDAGRNQWSTGEILGHTAPCSPDEPLFSFDEIKGKLIDHLASNHFDVSSLP